MSENNIEEQIAEPSPAEVEARLFGWKPLDEFRGDPAHWRDADAFLEKGNKLTDFCVKTLIRSVTNYGVVTPR
jgi:hypothetical protein